MRKYLSIVVFLFLGIASQAHGAEFWTANVSQGTGDGLSPENAIGWSTNTVAGLMGGTLRTGNTVYVCGTLTSTSTWNPGGVSDLGGFLKISGNATESGCAEGGWDQDFGGSTLVAIGGTSRANIWLDNLFFRDCTSNCVQADGTNIMVTNSTFYNSLDNHIRIGTLRADNITVTGNTFYDWGNSTISAEGAVNITPATSTGVTNVQVINNTFTGNGVARYAVSNYPLSNGTSTDTVIRGNTFLGSYSSSPVNVSNNATNTLIEKNDFTNMTSAGGVVIHTGGQGGVGACPTRTFGTIIQDNIGVHGAIYNEGNQFDASGILVDECSFATQVLRNETYDNENSGIYLNDADGTVVVGNTTWGNGHNCINLHGTSTNNVFYNNSCYHNPTNPANTANNGLDGVQVDSISTGNVFRNNIFFGGAIASASTSIKGIDADATITASNNNVYGFGTLREGFTDTNGTSVYPNFKGGSIPNSSDDFKLTTNELGSGGYSLLPKGTDQTGRVFEPSRSVGAHQYGYRDFTSRN